MSQGRLWSNEWIIGVLWIIHLTLNCFFLFPLSKMVFAWLRYRKWVKLILNDKKYELKELALAFTTSKSSKEYKPNSQKALRSFNSLKEKILTPK